MEFQNLRNFVGFSRIFRKLSCNSYSKWSYLSKGQWSRASGAGRPGFSTNPSRDEPMSENDFVNPEFENRNPRNLEKMSLARKPKGWPLDYPPREYWHKIFLDLSGRHTTARVEHFTGTTVVSASTQEWAIKKHLYSTRDISAAENVGRILAHRCLESGILNVHVHFSQEDQQSEKVKAFLSALESEGLSLEEPFRLYPVRPWH